jgi:hypothetical protein
MIFMDGFFFDIATLEIWSTLKNQSIDNFLIIGIPNNSYTNQQI